MIGRSVCLNTFTMELTFFSRNALRLCRLRAGLGAESNTLPLLNQAYPTIVSFNNFQVHFGSFIQKKKFQPMVARCPLRIFSPTLPVGSVAECSQCSAPAGARAQQPHTVQGPSFLCADLVQSTPGFVAGGWLSVLILKCTRIFLP